MQSIISFSALLVVGILFSSCAHPSSPAELRAEFTEEARNFLEDGYDKDLRELLAADKKKVLMKSSFTDNSFEHDDVEALHPLMQAIVLPASQQRRIDLMRILLAAGADVNMTMDSTESVKIEQPDGSTQIEYIYNGYTPLHLACSVTGDSDEIVKFIIDSGADVKALVKDNSPLDLAVNRLKVDAAKHLIQAGAEVKKLRLEGYETPQHIAVHGMKALPMIDFLLKNGFGINKKNDHGATFLHYSSSNDGCECHPQTDYSDEIRLVEALMKRGANPYIRDNNGRNALDKARDSLPYTKELVNAMEKK